MRLVLAHAGAMTLELVRYPAYLVPTLLLPPVFFLFFVAPGTRADAAARLATFSGFAVIGVAFFQFGVGIAVERGSPWESYLRTLPVAPRARLGARLLSAALFGVAAAALVAVTAVATTGASLPWRCWLLLTVTLAVGTVPFGLLGVALGYWAPPKAALPIANLLYLLLSYAGGLWTGPASFPRPVAAISPYLPTRALSDALVAAALGLPAAWRAWLALAGFAAVFGCAAAAGYRRDEGRRFA